MRSPVPVCCIQIWTQQPSEAGELAQERSPREQFTYTLGSAGGDRFEPSLLMYNWLNESELVTLTRLVTQLLTGY